jgi:CheY-like chemotaxis protein
MARATIMIVDDNPDVVYTIKHDLEAMEKGYTVIGVNSGKECLDKVKDVKPDIIFMDIIMPDMDGRSTAAKLKGDEETANIPVIYLTVKNITDDVGAMMKTFVASDYIQKPFFLEELKACVEKTIKRRKKAPKRKRLPKKPGKTTKPKKAAKKPGKTKRQGKKTGKKRRK